MSALAFAGGALLGLALGVGSRWLRSGARSERPEQQREPGAAPGGDHDPQEEAARQEEAALQEEVREARFALALQASGVGTWTWDLRTNEIQWDELSEAVFGEGADYRTFKETLHEEDRERVQAAIDEAIRTREPYRCSYRVVRPGVAERRVLAMGQARYDAEGAPVVMAGVVLDETEREQLATALELRTHQLSRLNEDLDQFASRISHDLKAPLRAIDGLSAWLIDDLGPELSGENRQHLELLRERVKLMGRLLNELLRFAKVGVGQPCEEVDFAALVRNAEALISPPPGLRVTLGECPPPFGVVRAPFEQVLRNLLDNAVKHHDRPEGRVEVGAEVRGAFVEFEVRDDGPGIPVEQRQRVFELFVTARELGDSEGTGMGLAFVRRLVHRFGGTIEIDEGLDGRGCCFRVAWPLLDQSSEVGRVLAESSGAGPVLSESRRGR